MADGFGVEVDTVAFEGAMQRLKSGVRAGFIDPMYGTLTVQARLLSERCQDFTPPRSVSQGNAAVARDLTKIYAPQNQRTYTDPHMRKIVRRDDRAAWNAASEHFTSALRSTKAVSFSEQWHQQNRDKRGRAFRQKYNFGVVTLGPQANLARQYMKKIKARVGWAKAGWNMGILSFGGYVKNSWIARHSVNRGKITDGRQLPEPFIAVLNDTGWAKSGRGEGERIVRNAINARIRDMQSYYERMMKLAADKAQKAA